MINTDVVSGWDDQCECRCSRRAASVRISRNIKVGCLLLLHSPVFFPVPPHSLSPRLQLHCYKQESHCALLLSTETDGERGKGDAGKDKCLERKGGNGEERRHTEKGSVCAGQTPMMP